MWIQPPLPLVLGAIFVTGFVGYLFYQTWFGIENMYQQAKENIKKLPSWYPFVKYYLRRLENKKSWIIERRIMSIFGLLFLLLYDGLIIVAMIRGK